VKLPTPSACSFDIAELTEEDVNNVLVLKCLGCSKHCAVYFIVCSVLL